MTLVRLSTFVCQEFVAHCGREGVSFLATNFKIDVKILTLNIS